MPALVVGRVLDLGCGPGTLALVAARRGAFSATGTDINPRAIRMAELNARMNELTAQVTFVVGDLGEPVRGERFDLVVAQPPFVMQPQATSPIIFVHGGPTGESITLRAVAALPDLLVPGGRALILAQSPTRPVEPLHQRFRRELGDANIDVVVLATPATSPDQQALLYATLEAPAGGPEYTAAVARYADHLNELDISALTHALIVARSRDPGASGQGHRFAATIPIKGISADEADAVDTLIASLNMASVDDAALAAARLRASPFAHWVEERASPDPAAEPARSVRFSPGRFATDVDDLSDSGYRTAGLVHTSASVEDAAREYARTSGLESSAARAQMLRFVREALGRGLLEVRA
jgi:hypothetical protein